MYGLGLDQLHGQPFPIPPEESDGPKDRSVFRKDVQALSIVQGVIGFMKI